MDAPFYAVPVTVRTLMGKVLIALIPGVAISTYFFGIAVLVQLLLATVIALGAEAIVLKLRKFPIRPFLMDGSAVLTAWLLALSIPPLSYWMMIVVGTLFAIIIAKHLYGGLGNNIFNPAMVGFAVLIIAFPKALTNWSLPHDPLTAWEQIILIFTDQLPSTLSIDAVTSATPLDVLKTQLLLGKHSLHDIMLSPQFGYMAGKAYEWITLAYLFGGLWMWQQKIIAWRTPVAMLIGLCIIALPLWIYDPSHYANPIFHMIAGATMLGAFFIATDPVTSPTTPRGQIIFGFLVGVLIYVIRVFGGFPDAIAFAILIMNIAVPFIDRMTRPPVFGENMKVNK